MLLLRKIAASAVFLLVISSNLLWQLTNNYLAVFLAILAALSLYLVIGRVMQERAYAEMRRLYGRDWG